MTLIALRFLKYFRGSLRDLLPILAVIAFFQVFIFQSVPDNLGVLLIGIFLVWFGLALFLLGLEYGIFPIGKKLTDSFAKRKGYILMMIFGFCMGFSATIAEPALFIIAEQASQISEGRINSDILRYIVALSTGLSIVLGIYRIIKGFPLQYIIISGYIGVIILTYFAPQEIIGISYDIGGVTTSTITVPLVVALGIGIASFIPNRNPSTDGFGMIAIIVLTPILLVQIYGIIVYSLLDSHAASIVQSTQNSIAKNFLHYEVLISEFIRVVRDIIPIIGTIVFFQYVILKKKIPFSELKYMIAGMGFVLLGLYTFIIGLEIGIIDIGKSIAFSLTELGKTHIIFMFAFLIGFSTTMAEPTLIAIAHKSSEISNGKINPLILRIFVALGVAIGITLGAQRILDGGSIQYYIMAGYIAVIIITFFAPRYIIPLAYDSGGVTTSTITVPLVTALGIGLATHTLGRNPLLDGFGLIAFASVFPIFTVMLYGIAVELQRKKHEQVSRNAVGINDILK